MTSPKPESQPAHRDVDEAARSELAKLAGRYGLPSDAVHQLERLFGLLLTDPRAPTSIRTSKGVLEDHLADSLVGLEVPAVAGAQTVLDLGSGAGLPGLPLAIALPQIGFTLLESSSRKCAFLERVVEACGVDNAEVVHARVESFTARHGCYAVVTARAVAPLPVTAEYAAPLLRVGGHLVAWQGRRDPDADRALADAARELGFGESEIRRVHPYETAANRHLYLLPKVRQTPDRFPRRPGIALKRPLGGRRAGPRGHRQPPQDGTSSDRVQR